jgi:hypothetical protein
MDYRKEYLMKKIITILVLLSTLFVASNAFAAQGFALGGAFTMDFAGSAYVSGGALCVKFPSVPIMFGFSANFLEPMMIGITADWWLYNARLVGPVSIYIGPGLFLRLATGGRGDTHVGIRVPFGFQIFIIPPFEIFLEPAFAIELMPQLPTFSLQAAIGFRFWF